MRDKPEQNGIGMPFCSGLFLPQKKWMTNEKTTETDKKYKHNI